MKNDELKPLEEVIDSVVCNYPRFEPNDKGIMIITTCRVLWKPIDSNHFPLHILRSFVTNEEDP